MYETKAVMEIICLEVVITKVHYLQLDLVSQVMYHKGRLKSSHPHNPNKTSGKLGE